MKRRAPMVLAMAALLAGCGGGASLTTGQAAVAPVGGDVLGSLPRVAGSEPLGEVEVDDEAGTRSQHHRVTGTTPRRVMRFYEDELIRWEATEAPAPVGPATFRATWDKDGRTLIVLTGPAPAIVPGSAVDYRLTVTRP